MSLETSTYVNSFNQSWPDGLDQRATADDHLRMMKAAILRTWPQITGAVVVSQTEMNFLLSLSQTVQHVLNSLADAAHLSASATFHKAVVFEEFVTLKAGIGGAVVNLGTLSATLNIDPKLGNYFAAVLSGNVTSISIGAAISAGQVLSIRFQQAGAGSFTVGGWPATVVFADGASATYSMRATASALALLTMARDPLGLWLTASREFG